MNNPTATFQSLQDYCEITNSTVSFGPCRKIVIGQHGGPIANMTPSALANHVTPAANDNHVPATTLSAAGYESLAHVLARAFDQASNGKGQERHANALPFHKQPMQVIAGQVGPAFLTGQAIKKIQESQVLPARRDVAELLGAINYIAGVVIYLENLRAANDPVANG